MAEIATEQAGARHADAERTRGRFRLSEKDWSKLNLDIQLALMEAAGLFDRGNDNKIFVIFGSDEDGNDYELMVCAKNGIDALAVFQNQYPDQEYWDREPHCYEIPTEPGNVGIVAWSSLGHTNWSELLHQQEMGDDAFFDPDMDEE